MSDLLDIKINANKRIPLYLKEYYGIGTKKVNVVLNGIGLGCDIRSKNLDQIYYVHIFHWLNYNDFILDSRLKNFKYIPKYKCFMRGYYKNEFN